MKNKSVFYTEESFNLDIDLGREYFSNDMNFKIKYFEVDVVNSVVDDIYGESYPSDKKILPPIELTIIPEVMSGEQFAFSETSIIRDDVDSINIFVYQKELSDKNVDVKRGDYFVYEIQPGTEYLFEVTNANNANYGNEYTIAGSKPFYKKITAIPVKSDSVNLSEFL